MVSPRGWILDVSVAAKWYLRDEELLDEADEILRQFGDGETGLGAPGYFLDETGNIFRTAVRRGRIPAERARLDYAALLALGIVIVDPTSARRATALDLALTHDIAFYDALYLQLAQELGLPPVTADWPLYERIASAFPGTTYLGSLSR